jgi:hypothetical protein
MTRLAIPIITALLLAPVTAPEPAPSPPPPGKAILLTIFLRHDQSRTLPEINAQLEKNGWSARFPPAGCDVVSWYVMMGIGQVVTLRVPPEKLRDVNLAVENAGWGAYRTDFYPTYDFKPIWEEQQRRRPPQP